MKEGEYTYLSFIERVYQDEVLKLFDKLGYRYLGNMLYQKNAQQRSDGGRNMPLIEAEVKAYLRSAGYTEMQVNDAYAKLKDKAYLPNKAKETLMKVNNAFYEFLIGGAKCKPSVEENEENVYFIDFKDFGKNRFAIAEEVSYTDGLTGANCRPDLVIYVNGIAVAVIELKRTSVSLREGIKQMLSNECDLIPSFFTTVQFTVAASNGNGFKYGTINAAEKFWCPFKTDGQKVGTELTDMEAFEAFFDKETFVRLLRYGVVNDGGVKKVMRPHQYHALVHAIPRLEQKESGVIWHSQGSGKSLTMVWLASYIKANFKNPRVIIVTDRTELDLQIKSGFVRAGESVGHAKSGKDLLDKLNSGSEWLICSLIHKFGRHTDEQNDDNDVKIRLDSYLEELRSLIKEDFPGGFSVKGDNVFVFVDECHRTQGGMLHEAMKEIMGKDVMLIGFTGTPLLKVDKGNEYEAFVRTSEYRFGHFIHKYLHKEAVADQVILDLQYEARDVEQAIGNKDKLDEMKAKITEGLSEKRVELVEQRWATLKSVYSSKERIERIAYSIIDDVKYGMLAQDWCNAMLVAGDIYSAYKYYEFFQNNCPDKCLRNRCAVVTSYSASDYDKRLETSDPYEVTRNQFKNTMAMQSFSDATMLANETINTSEKYEAWAKKQFINYPANMKLLIVVDKLLTGFDAPCATYLYIDKDMRDHGLFQALCRVNRLGVDLLDPLGKQIVSHKEFGLIVDFKHLFSKITEAVTNFNDENGGLGNYDPSDVEGLLQDSVDQYKKRLLSTKQSYVNLKTHWAELGLNDMDALKEYYLTDDNQATLVENGEGVAEELRELLMVKAEEKRTVLYKITGDYIVAYSNIANYMGKAGFTSAEADAFEALAKEAAQIREEIKQVSGDAFDPRQYDPAMRELIDRFMKADEAETIVEATADFSFLDLIAEQDDVDDITKKVKEVAKSDKAAAEVIEGKVRCVINSYKLKDPELYKLFSEKLQSLLDKLKEDRMSFLERVKELVELVKEAKGGGNHYPEGVQSNFGRAFWNNKSLFLSTGDEHIVVKTIQKIEELIYFDAERGWQDPMSPAGYRLLSELKDELPCMNDEQIREVYKLAVANI